MFDTIIPRCNVLHYSRSSQACYPGEHLFRVGSILFCNTNNTKAQEHNHPAHNYTNRIEDTYRHTTDSMTEPVLSIGLDRYTTGIFLSTQCTPQQTKGSYVVR